MQYDTTKFKELLIKDISCRYSVSQCNAADIVKKSAINRLLLKYPDLIMHDPISSTSSDVWNEHLGSLVEQ